MTNMPALLLGALLTTSTPATAQTALSAALDLYAAAAYDDALIALEALANEPSSPEVRRLVDQHRMLCLMALGRIQAAEVVAAQLLEAQPDFTLAEREASPRVRAMFDATRRRVLPRLARRTYADAKLAFDDGRYGEARRGFQRLDQMLSDEGAASDPTLGDLRTLTTGFLRLIAAALDGPAPLPAVAVPISAQAPLPAATDAPSVETPAGASPAIRELPSVVEILAARRASAPPPPADDEVAPPALDATAEAGSDSSAALARRDAPAPTPPPATAAVASASPAQPVAAEVRGESREDAAALAPAEPVVEAPAAMAGAASAPSTPAAAAMPAPPPFTPIDGVFVYDWRDRDVVPPVTLAQPVSGWWGSRGAPAPGTQLGAVDVVIDEQGRVAEARIYLSVNRVFDTVLLQSVGQWRFEPATKGGRPVKYRRVTGVVAGR